MSAQQFIRNGLAAAAIVCLTGHAGHAQAIDQFWARLSGFQQTGSLTSPTGAILSKGKGTLRLTVVKNSIAYTLGYSGLGTAVTQAHVHFGQQHVAGGIMAFLCTNLGNGPAGTPVCPQAGGFVQGTLTSASVVGPTAQNVAVGDLNALLSALDFDTAYVNVHTSGFPSGEIRGQILPRNPNDED